MTFATQSILHDINYLIAHLFRFNKLLASEALECRLLGYLVKAGFDRKRTKQTKPIEIRALSYKLTLYVCSVANKIYYI